MPRRPRRLARRLAALAPVLAAFGGQALAAGSLLRAPFLPHAGTTPAPSFDPAAASCAAGLAALRRAAAQTDRADLRVRTAALLRTLGVAPTASDAALVSHFDDIDPPGPLGGGRRPSDDVTEESKGD